MLRRGKKGRVVYSGRGDFARLFLLLTKGYPHCDADPADSAGVIICVTRYGHAGEFLARLEIIMKSAAMSAIPEELIQRAKRITGKRTAVAAFRKLADRVKGVPAANLLNTTTECALRAEKSKRDVVLNSSEDIRSWLKTTPRRK